MLFNSYLFIFEFVPATILAFFVAAKISRNLALLALIIASLVFYSGWSGLPWLVVVSFTFNYLAARLMVWSRARLSKAASRLILPAAISFNLLLLVYYKYTKFLIYNIDAVAGAHWPIPSITLPIGISFFTFTQIAFLVDVSRREADEPAFLRYGLFVTYFPHLLAGPIIHHANVMPQFDKASIYKFSPHEFGVGLTIFIFGLFKKVALADSFSPGVNLAFSGDHTPLIFEAWRGVLAYTLQIYFDFSGYSDMAIGLSRMFGIELPLNFNSPYKASSIIEFWRRWHMTLSRFLRDYLYISLGGNRKGRARRYFNLYITMLLGGIWHGAGWTFAIWGALHGLYLILNHAWRHLLGERTYGIFGRLACHIVTFLAVVAAWVFFRAPSVSVALVILKGMAGLNNSPGLSGLLVEPFPKAGFAAIAFGLFVVFTLPNTQQILAAFRPGFSPFDRSYAHPSGRWHIARLSPAWGIIVGIVFFLALTRMSHVTEFIYYQF
jgi:alginate O-acetyltransferase complex protein AlgI